MGRITKRELEETQYKQQQKSERTSTTDGVRKTTGSVEQRTSVKSRGGRPYRCHARNGSIL